MFSLGNRLGNRSSGLASNRITKEKGNKKLIPLPTHSPDRRTIAVFNKACKDMAFQRSCEVSFTIE